MWRGSQGQDQVWVACKIPGGLGGRKDMSQGHVGELGRTKSVWALKVIIKRLDLIQGDEGVEAKRVCRQKCDVIRCVSNQCRVSCLLGATSNVAEGICSGVQDSKCDYRLLKRHALHFPLPASSVRARTGPHGPCFPMALCTESLVNVHLLH